MTSRKGASPSKKLEESHRGQIFPPAQDNNLHPLVNEQRARDIWNLILMVRLINSLCVKTFFQPDEYFQSLEPAWQLAFGSDSGAWITWEWKHQLRSSLHPALLAALYYVVDKPMEFLGFFPQFRAMILGVLPNVAQAFIAATGDYYTWKFSEKIYGLGSHTGWITLLITLFSPWQWFISTRTFSNCLETTLTVTALYFWPWAMALDPVPPETPKQADNNLETPVPAKEFTLPSIFEAPGSLRDLRISLFLAITACILRPTNTMIWLCVLTLSVTGFFSSTPRISINDFVVFLREGVLCGLSVLVLSILSDRLYFGFWTFPPYQFLTFNITLDLAVFYGRNDWHYYLSQGLPLLLTTYLPFTLAGLYKVISLSGSGIELLLTTIIFQMIASLSLISHKEVRFIYPLLPLLHILTAPTIFKFFYTTTTKVTHPPPFPSSPKLETITIFRRKSILLLLLLTNLFIAYYTTRVHQSGVLSVLPYLRNEYESLALDNRGVLLSSPSAGEYEGGLKISNYDESETFVGFLMPCHSTPWRSQLFYPGLKAWALTCEPPIDVPKSERAAYRDEADRFYDDPIRFLKEEVNTKERPWPRYIAGFEGIEGILKEYYEQEMKGFVVKEKWRVKNSDWHDDERRQGDVVVWEFVDGSRVIG
ncbi:Alg9-like mannosyltransferase family-domain-containing protein [Bisporella sp. PMI_857]|nr:Alg9-like mannosyltransferase family-domain-containing protein [Bisporella sp. PMI_857]